MSANMLSRKYAEPLDKLGVNSTRNNAEIIREFQRSSASRQRNGGGLLRGSAINKATQGG
ncbi:MAG: hypothetical protein COS29_04340 [Candidatus Omnitrophica bacterium CG02_land_8_20_14_3_00__42_8]|nr:MAG: hypothetical protein COS29_04340 [Candidatus Omnitrophica bacterium CG02_land_8_20_14_3_00__42_8]